MEFQILSHAGLKIRKAQTELLVDPWIVGSSYWRSWWNYPPVSKELVANLKPDFIYLTHIHWDHFQGPSLRRFSKDTRFLIPKGNYDRMARDLRSLGFKQIQELRHGEKIQLSEAFSLTSYQFFPWLDSAAVIECDGVTLFDANDAKFMGWPLRQILKRHPKIDFVFRSHSSANGRLCYEVVDKPEIPVDDESSYIQSFASFAKTVNARYAIPFASNHCFLHKDVFPLNHTIKTPYMVKAYFENRDERLENYRNKNQGVLEKFYIQENSAKIYLRDFEKYFSGFFRSVPWIFRLWYRSYPIRFVLRAGEKFQYFYVQILMGLVLKRSFSYDKFVAKAKSSPANFRRVKSREARGFYG